MKPVSTSGTVKQYRGDGRRLGYPTANIELPDDNLAEGVYFGVASLGDYSDKPALIFVGVPHVTKDNRRRLEAHLLGIEDQDYYGQTLKVTLLYYHRANQNFASETDLTRAIEEDERVGRAWFKGQALLS